MSARFDGDQRRMKWNGIVAHFILVGAEVAPQVARAVHTIHPKRNCAAAGCPRRCRAFPSQVTSPHVRVQDPPARFRMGTGALRSHGRLIDARRVVQVDKTTEALNEQFASEPDGLSKVPVINSSASRFVRNTFPPLRGHRNNDSSN